MENWPQVDTLQYRDRRVGYRYPGAQGGRRGHLWRPCADAAVARHCRPAISRRLGDGNHQIDEGLRGSIEFTRANLIDAQDMARYRNFDLIFCRNVLIYFDDASRRQAAENLYDCLRPGGYICLGHSESMSRISPLFSVCRFPDAIVYQRPEADHG